jgi:hypothetical protein
MLRKQVELIRNLLYIATEAVGTLSIVETLNIKTFPV